jgi:hypothetical protein
MEMTDVTAGQDQSSEPQAPKLSLSEELRPKIAAKIRQDSEARADLTPSGALVEFFTGLDPQEAEPILVDLLDDEAYGDIKGLMTSDDLYFYSTLYLEPLLAEEKVMAEEILFRIATTVRQQSKETARLTPVTALLPVLADLEVEDVEPNLAALLEDARYQDIEQVVLPSGATFLYSKRYITANYAKLLARSEGGDPLASIAETVRDESRIYPRPTDTRLFAEQPFDMKRDDIPILIEQLLEQEAYSDIVKIVASTGTVYLYSEEYMERDLAVTLVEWEEVGRFENP